MHFVSVRRAGLRRYTAMGRKELLVSCSNQSICGICVYVLPHACVATLECHSMQVVLAPQHTRLACGARCQPHTSLCYPLPTTHSRLLLCRRLVYTPLASDLNNIYPFVGLSWPAAAGKKIHSGIATSRGIADRGIAFSMDLVN